MSANGQLQPSELAIVDGWAKLSPATARAYNAAKKYILDHFHIEIVITFPDGAYRSMSRQLAVKQLYGKLAATPGTSPHGFGIAFDMNNITAVIRAVGSQQAVDAILARFGFARNAGNGSGGTEQWHYGLVAVVDIASLAGATELHSPIPAPPTKQEDDDMAKNSGFIYKRADGVSICGIVNAGSGFFTEWQDGGGAYNSALAVSFDTGDFAPVSESHRNNLAASAAATRPRA
jgi:hypothetical protein